jgi:hypothetical protein
MPWDQPKTLSLRALGIPFFRASVPTVAVCESDLLAAGIATPALVFVSNTSFTCDAWLEKQDGRTNDTGEPLPVAPGTILLSVRTSRALGIAFSAIKIGKQTESPPTIVTLTFIPSAIFRARVSLADDLPAANQVQLSSDWHLGDPDHFRGTRWALLVHRGFVAPVELQYRDTMADDEVRMSRFLRSVVGIDHENAALHAAPLLLSDTRLGHWQRLGRALRRLPHAALVHLLGAPQLVFRTSRAELGDDTERVVRIHASLFPLLAISPGDHVMVDWAHRRAIAVALEQVEHGRDRSRPVAAGVRVGAHEGDTPEDPEGVLSRFTISIAAPIRVELGIPHATVVTVHRRVGSLLRARITQAVLPITAVILTAVAIPSIPHWVIALLAIAIAYLTLIVPARKSRPPAGRR